MYLGIAIFLLLFLRITLQIIGLIYFIRYHTEIKTIDKLLLFVPEILPVKSIINYLSETEYQNIKKYLKWIYFYKIFFLLLILFGSVNIFMNVFK